jgi:hypothetical protein
MARLPQTVTDISGQPWTKPTIAKLFEQVDGLGTTSQEIADNLRLENIRAYPSDPVECALSQYALKHYPELDISTGAANMSVRDGLNLDIHVLPSAHIQFVMEFDRGQYPDLVAGNYQVLTGDLPKKSGWSEK